MAKSKSGDRRLAVVAIVLVLGLAVVAGKLALLQGIQAEHYKELASDQRDTHIQITPRRGTVFDREGEILAISEDVTTVYATPYQIKNPEAAAKGIAEVLGEDPEDVQDKLDSNSGFVYLARKLDKTLANRIKEMDIEGVGFVDESKRFYPMGEFASQVLGVVDIDNKGQAGLELYYEDTLGGKPGEVLLERDAVGNPIPGSEKRRVQAVDGVDLQLTIDKDIQACVEESLRGAVDRHGARAGTAVVLDCNTGDILAMATSPGFDPNDRAMVEPEAMRNRAVTDVYEPGSVLKVVTAVGALEEGVVEPNSVIQVPSQLQVADEVFTDAEPTAGRALEFKKVISQSSNVGTIQVALMLGNSRLSDYLDRFGLGHRTGIDFPGEVGGLVPAVSDWSGTSIATISIGQGISITPLQLACLAGAVANGGRRICPHFLKAKITEKGVEDMGLGGLGEEILSGETCQEMTGIMEQVVAPGGTGTRAAVSFYRVAGKTGTAAKARENAAGYTKRYMATFVGFAPAERPRVVVLVVLDEPSPIWGGHTSAPVFKEIMGYSLQHLNIPPSLGPSPHG
ncbi:MAG: penicillin-binding protein 2 [Actinomycetia bacterium]|nr:penicillin-binding protein 2 [Actinomycetes bacterium]